MVFPFLPVVAGVGGGLLTGLLFGGKKESAATSKTTTTYHPYAFYQPTISKQIQHPSYQFIVDSPFADQTASKKMTSTQQPSISAPISPVASAGAEPVTAGASLMPFVLVGGAALIGYAVISKPKRRR